MLQNKGKTTRNSAKYKKENEKHGKTQERKRDMLPKKKKKKTGGKKTKNRRIHE